MGVQAKLDEKRVARATRLKSNALLIGKLFNETGERMTPSYAIKQGVRYRYYISTSVMQSRDRTASATHRLPAPALEAAVVDALRSEVEKRASKSAKRDAVFENAAGHHNDSGASEGDASSQSPTSSISAVERDRPLIDSHLVRVVVSFVSVTQAFNTTTSMGRLTLNVLLSFAQFEREVTGERIRDKIAASKKKGLWMGGLPSLGYEVKDRKLAVVKEEAERVRLIFRRYLDLGCVRALREDLIARGVVSKRRVYEDGRASGGLPFSREALYHLLNNPIYRGMIVHRENAYPGERAPIVDQELWEAVQAKLQANGVERSDIRKLDSPAILTGLLYDIAGEPMTPTHAAKKGVRYRYYVSRHLVTGVKSDGPGHRLPAPAIETLVIARLREFLAEPGALEEALPELARDATARKLAAGNAPHLIRLLDEEANPRREVLLRAVLRRVQVHTASVEVALCRHSINRLLLIELSAWDDPDSIAAASLANGPRADKDMDSAEIELPSSALVRLMIPAQMRRRGNEMKFVIEGENAVLTRSADETLVRLIVRAKILARRIRDNPAATLEEIAAQEGFGSTYAGRLLRLTSLAPSIVTAILEGRQPPELTANVLMAETRLPLDWAAQWAVLGFSRIGAAA